MQGSLLRTHTVVTSPFFLKVWTEITGPTITDSFLLRLRKLMYMRVVVSDADACNRNDKLSDPPSPIPQLIVITSIPY